MNVFEYLSNVSKLAYAAMGVGVFMALFLFRLFFDGWSGFWEDFNDYSFWRRPTWGQMKVNIWLLISFGCGVLAYHQLPHWLPSLFR